ncbi:MAG: GTPase HflX [Clostridia bacterium]|nr:GTPase HflX [Clostridia bacterium]
MEEKIITSAVLVGMAENTAASAAHQSSLDELERLLETAGGVAFAKVLQIKSSFDPRTCIGSGKVLEIKALCEANGIDLVIFDFELTAGQIRSLEEDMGGEIRVIDRSMLILDIFALHATSGEGKLQVELAQLKYTAPRLMGQGKDLSRQGGGIGSRGPGESKLESDRRHLKERIRALEAQLAEMEHTRSIMRRQRDKSGLKKIAIVGYTNAGKSTLLNALTDAGVLSENKLFATLDPTTRRLELPSGESVLLTDTVGFIRRLPHHLVEAFRSTLDEVRYADILMIVADVSDPELSEQLVVTDEIIESLDAKDKPRIVVYNKCDSVEGLLCADLRENAVAISAKQGLGIDLLLSKVEDILHKQSRECELLFPYDAQSKLNDLYRDYGILSSEYEADGTRVRARLDEKGRGLFKKYIVE